MAERTPSFELVDTDRTDLHFRDALADLFSGDGTIYLVSGYFTYQGYRSIRDEIVSFLERSPDNELVAIVGPSSDQFSPRIATDLWSIEQSDQVRIYKQPRGLHAKLYFRDGPDPRCIIGSANITQVAFEYNTELNIELGRDTSDHPDLKLFLEWIEELIAESPELRRRDIVAPVLMSNSVINWSNKARILPVRNVALRVVPVLLLLILFASVFRIV